jgi:4-amino-4-deoxy-L-arabinose transferase-like glycosyltransferase
MLRTRPRSEKGRFIVPVVERHPCRARVAVDAVLWTLVAIAFFAGIGRYPLSDNNEGLYAAIGADMLRTGHFMVPQLAGLPYIEKPPLLYWLLAASFAVFGENAFAARLVPATAALATAAVLFWLLRVCALAREARVAVLVFGTSFGAVLLAHILLFDMLLVFGLTLTLAGVAYSYLGQGEPQWSLRLAAVGLGLAILAKGFVAAVLVGMIVLVTQALDRKWRVRWSSRVAEPWAAAILAALVIPWHVLATMHQNGFAWFYFINEHVLRFIGSREPRDFHHGHWYFYLPRLLIALVPWVWLTPALVSSGSRPGSEAMRRLERVLLVWAFVPLLFFSLSEAKADYYIIVSLPPLAAWIALRICAAPRWSRLARCSVGVFLLNLIVLSSLPHLELRASGRMATAFHMMYADPVWIWVVMLVSFGAPLLAAKLFQARRLVLALGIYGLPTLALAVALPELARTSSTLFSDASLVNFAHSASPNALVVVYAVPERVSAALFYSAGKFRILDSRSADFAFAERLHYGAGRIFVHSESWRPSAQQPVLVLVPAGEMAAFRRCAVAGSFAFVSGTSTAVLLTSEAGPLREPASRDSARRDQSPTAAISRAVNGGVLR